MGVSGLTTYLRTHRLAVAKTVELNKDGEATQDTDDLSILPNVEIVVDGWGFIYMLYQTSKIPWVYGGEYDRFADAIKRTVDSWMSVGVNLSFVFDGPQEESKFQTRISRLMSSNVHHSTLFFRTSQLTRVAPRFLNETQIIPPLLYTTCVETLLDLSSCFTTKPTGISFPSTRPKTTLKVYFADREADPFMAELAARIGAYVAALDSDFVILNAAGYRGYIPLDELEWTTVLPPSDTARSRTVSSISVNSSIASLLSPTEISADSKFWEDLADVSGGGGDSEEGFKPVQKKKRARTVSAKSRLNPVGSAPTTRGVIPPDEFTSLVFPVYTPESTAASLGIPPPLLPLLAAFVGNDFTRKENSSPISTSMPHYSLQDFLYEHKLPAVKRIIYTANTLAAVLQGLSKPNGRKRKGGGIGVVDVIRTTTKRMLLRPGHTTDPEIDMIVNRIVEGALFYAIPLSSTAHPQALWPTSFCPLHANIDQCRLEALVPVEENDTSPRHSPSAQKHSIPSQSNPLIMVQNQYIQAYRAGILDPKILDVLISGTMWPRIFLESPDMASCASSNEAAGPLRRWLYAILDQGIGVYVPLPEPEDEVDEAIQKMVAEGQQPRIAPTKTTEDEESWDEEDEDEIIDVMDADSEEEDPLVALKGALQRLKGAKEESHLPTIPGQEAIAEEDESETEDEEENLPDCHVTEYVRRGARIAEEKVLVEDLNALIEEAYHQEESGFGQSTNAHIRTSPSHPIQLQEESSRLGILLLATGSNHPKVLALKKEWIAPVVAMRWLIRHAGSREVERGTFPGPMHRKWAKAEILALMVAFGVGTPWESAVGGQVDDLLSEEPIDLSERTIQLLARALSVIEAVQMIVQSLGLTTRVPLSLSRFRGRVFHRLCARSLNPLPRQQASAETTLTPEALLDDGVWDAVSEGLEMHIGDDLTKKKKKPKEKDTHANSQPKMNARGRLPAGTSVFSLLAGMDA